MADNFNVKKFLAENKLGPYSRLKETEEGYMGTQYDSSEDMAVDMLKKGITEKEKEESLKEGGDVFADIDDDIAYGTDSKEDAIEYLEDIIDYCQKKIVELENEQGYEEEDEELDEAIDAKSFGGILKSDNPEGDALVLRFLQGVAKKFNYPVAKAAIFVKDTIKSLGY